MTWGILSRSSTDTATSTDTAKRGASPASVLNVTTLALIFVVVIFAVVTQLLAANSAISLSTTVQLTMWLVALGFIILLAIAYMFFHVFETATRKNGVSPPPVTTVHANGHGDTAQEAPQPGQDAGSPRNPTVGPRPFVPGWSPNGGTREADDAWVPPDKFRHLEGSEYSVTTAEVFPDGCYLEPDSITLVSGTSTGQQVYECRVVDRNPELKDRPHETVVKILAAQQPSQASMPRFSLVEFEDLTITPYVTDQDPMWIRYSLRATGLHPAPAAAARVPTTWTAAVS